MSGNDNSNNEKMSKKKKIIIASSIAAGMLVVFAVVLIFGYFYLGNKKGDSDSTEAGETEIDANTETICWIICGATK